jgi:type IV secretion system protein VirB5
MSSAYQNALEAYNVQCGDTLRSISRWRSITFALVIMNFFSIGSLAYVEAVTELYPYLIEIDVNNRVKKIKIFSEVEKINIDEQAIKSVLAEYLSNLRSVYIDNGIQISAIDKAFSTMIKNSQAWKYSQEYLKENNPIFRSEKETVSVDIETIEKLASGIFNIEWLETTRNKAGYLENSQKHRATVEIKFKAPVAFKTARLNPLGLYITNIQMSDRY